MGEQFLPQSQEFGPLQARQFLDFGADFGSHVSSPVRMTLPLYGRGKSTETEMLTEMWAGFAPDIKFISHRIFLTSPTGTSRDYEIGVVRCQNM